MTHCGLSVHRDDLRDLWQKRSLEREAPWRIPFREVGDIAALPKSACRESNIEYLKKKKALFSEQRSPDSSLSPFSIPGSEKLQI